MKKALLLLRSYLPRPLPVGLTEFHEWADRIISLSGQFADVDSMKWALASQVMHLGAQKSSVPDQFFIRSMRKAAANQVASQVFQDIKIKQQEQQKAQAEATAPQESAPSDGQEIKS